MKDKRSRAPEAPAATGGSALAEASRSDGSQQLYGNAFMQDMLESESGGGEAETARSGFQDRASLPYKTELEAAFGADLSGVEAYGGPAASEAADALGARAYALGHRIAFADRSPDRALVAHEVAHTIQTGPDSGGAVSAGGGGLEADADQAAAAFLAGAPVQVQASGAPAVLRWGGADHYAIGNLAGKKALALAGAPSGTMEVDQFAPNAEGGIDRSKGQTMKARTGEHTSASFGALARFSGDYGFDAEANRDQQHETLLHGRTNAGVDSLVTKAKGSRDIIHNAAEGALVATTNTNHFYPLNQNEWATHHRKALAAADAGDEATAMLEEGFASHFLMDSFAAGHFVPRGYESTAALTNKKKNENVLVRVLTGVATLGLSEIARKVTPTIELIAGGLTKSRNWHDFFNTLPAGLPTTKGRFHGDNTMNGADLGHVSDVASRSLAEVTARLQGEKLDFGVGSELPQPDFSAIMSDPVAGPPWRMMMSDYDSMMDDAEGIEEGEQGTSSGGADFDSRSVVDATRRDVFGRGLITGPMVSQSLGSLRSSVLTSLDGVGRILTEKAGANNMLGVSGDLEEIEDVHWDRRRGTVLGKTSRLESDLGLLSNLESLARSYQKVASRSKDGADDLEMAGMVLQKATAWQRELKALEGSSNKLKSFFGGGKSEDDVKAHIAANLMGLSEAMHRLTENPKAEEPPKATGLPI